MPRLRCVRLLPCLLLLFACGGCATRDRTQSPSPSPTIELEESPSSNELTIEANTQATFGDLRIGVGNIWEEEYTLEGGSLEKGLTAGLWFYFREDSGLDDSFRVYPGQILEVGGYRVRVIAVNETSVALEVGEPGS